MFPLLPALILLILQGSANLDASYSGATLQPALHVLQGMRQDEASKEAFVKAIKRSPALAYAFAHILGLSLVEDEPKVRDTAEPPKRIAYPDPEPLPLADGFLQCRRSRDGPI